MSTILLLCLGLVVAEDAPKPAENPSAEAALYQTAVEKAGKNGEAHARLALWCEAHGMTAERMKHLAMAVLYEPSNPLARGLMGLVPFKGKWKYPEDASRAIAEDPIYQKRIDEYLQRRAKTAMKAESQARLAAWCEENGLKEQAIAHYNEVLRLDPKHATAWRHLGYKKQGNRWVKPEERAAERREAERQKHADKVWRTKLVHIRDGLESKDSTRRARAERAAAEVKDSRAVPMIWAVMLRGSDRVQSAALQMLRQIDGPSASNALAALALYHNTPEIRARAIEILSRRDPRDVIGRLIRLIRKPFHYEVRRPNGPGTAGVLFVEGERYNIRHIYENPAINPATIPRRLFAPWVPFDPYNAQNMLVLSAAMNGMSWRPSGPSPVAAQQTAGAIAANPGNAAGILNNAGASSSSGSLNTANSMVYDTMAAAAYRDMQIAADYRVIQQASRNLQQRLNRDIQAVEATNLGIRQVNGRVLPILGRLTGQDFGAEPDRWKSWWTDQRGYVYESNIPANKPTYTDTLSVQTPFTVGATHTACFAAGTLVLAIDGARPIETIRVGDRVLSQDPTTGALSFRAVTGIHRNEPTSTLKMAVDGESIVATGIHRFWKAGRGWAMARELEPGDRLRAVGGITEVLSIEPDVTQPVYNLDVDADRDFFVGARGLLVHDFSFVQPVADPFDREPDLAALATKELPTRSMLGPSPHSSH